MSSSEQSLEELFAELVVEQPAITEGALDEWAVQQSVDVDAARRLYVRWRRGLAGLERLASERRGQREGERLGDFLLVRQLGRGGQANVWEAEQLSLARRVALKIVPPERLSERAVKLLQREAHAGGRLAHRGIVAVHALGETDGVHWIAQELVPSGRTVRDFIDEARDALDVAPGFYAQVTALVAEIADALQVAHDAGVVHRDVKPANILLLPDGAPKLTDFGLARVADERGVSQSGEVLGTYLYMSPEQVTGGRIDHRTDVFSLGTVLYELLSLRRPFDGDTSQQIVREITQTDPPDPRRIRSRVPRDLAVICAKCLEKRPERRYPAMRELAADLRRHLAREPIRARPASVAHRARRWVERHPTASTAVAVVLTALLVVGAIRRDFRGRTDALERRVFDERAADASRALRDLGLEWEVANDTARDIVGWLGKLEELATASYGAFGLDLGPGADIDAFAARFAEVQRLHPGAATELREGLYELAAQMFGAGVVSAWQAARAETPGRSVGGSAHWSRVRDEVPRVIELWETLVRVIDRVETSADRRRVWQAIVSGWRTREDSSFEELLDEPSLDGVELLMLGAALRYDGKHERAIDVLRRALGRDPSLGRAHYELATCYFKARQPASYVARALQHRLTLVALHPTSAWAHASLATTLALAAGSGAPAPQSAEAQADGWRFARDELRAEARRHAERAMALDPRVASALIGGLTENGDPSLAVELAEPALEQAPADDRLLTRYASALHALGRHVQEVEVAGLRVQHHPETADTWTARGKARYELAVSEDDTELLQRAVDDFRRALELGPSFSVNEWVGLARLRLGEVDEGLAELEGALSARRADAAREVPRLFASSHRRELDSARAELVLLKVKAERAGAGDRVDALLDAMNERLAAGE